MSLIVKVYPVPWKILALVKARILKNRAQRRKEGEGWDPKELRRQMQLQPGPLTKAMKKQEPSFILPDDTFSYLLRPTKEHEPEKPWDAYEFTAYGLPNEYFTSGGQINNAIINESGTTLDTITAFYSTVLNGEAAILAKPVPYPCYIIQTCTIEALIDATYIDQNLNEYISLSALSCSVTFYEMAKNGTQYSVAENYISLNAGLSYRGEQNGQVIDKAIALGCTTSNGTQNDEAFETTRQKSKAHMALVLSENRISGYIDGQRVFSKAMSEPNVLNPKKVYGILISTTISTKSNPFALQALRVTGGTALYAGKSFTPPTAITEPAA